MLAQYPLRFLLFLIVVTIHVDFAASEDDFDPFLLPSIFYPDNFWKLVNSRCDIYLPDLTSCLSIADKGRRLRVEAALTFSSCISEALTRTFLCGPWVKAYSHPPSNLTVERGCRYPDPLPLSRPPCEKYVDKLSKSDCCDTHVIGGGSNCTDMVETLLNCETFALIQYAHCTEWYKSDDQNATRELVGDCIQRNVEKLRWPVDLILTQAGDKCRSAAATIGFLALSNFMAIISALAGNAVRARFRRSNTTPDQDQGVKVNLLNLIFTFIVQLAVPAGILAVLGKIGYNDDDASRSMALWVVRPRAAFLIGSLGLVDPQWMANGLAEMLQDLAFGPLSVIYISESIKGKFNNEWSIRDGNTDRYDYSNHIPNPGYNTYIVGIGLMLACAAASLFIIWLLVFWKYMPWRALKEGFRFKCLYLHPGKVKKYYLMLIASSFSLFLGCWMVWGTLIHEAGELWCPINTRYVALILALYPIALNVVRVWLI